jgi:uridine phosphorylase
VTGHLRPTAAIAADVILPSDPGAALTLAQELLDKPLMANHSHGLWGYSGRSEAGLELTIQSTGIGGPSAATVLAELAGHGARRAIRVGRAVALEPALKPGDLALAGRALAADGASRALGVTSPAADAALAASFAAQLGERCQALTVASSDLFHDPAAARRRGAWLRAGAQLADLESAAVMAAGERLGVAVACGLVVAESAAGEHDEEAAERGLLALAAAAAAAFSTGPGAAQESGSETASLL